MTAAKAPRYRGSRETIKPGDKVAIMGDIYRQGKIVGEAPMVRGEVLRIYRHGDRGHWRANIQWDDHIKGFLMTGHDNWAYVRDLTLLKRGTVAKL